MAESSVHLGMKAVVRCELERQGYVVLEEPPFPPSNRISWSAYRPDLLAYRKGGGEEEVAIVECETHPSMRRFSGKNFASLWFQPHLFHIGLVRRILAVPRGRLRAVDMNVRKEWEIWVLGASGPISLIGKSEEVEWPPTARIPSIAAADP